MRLILFKLVGTALIVIVRSDITGNIRRVEAATRKVSYDLPCTQDPDAEYI